MRECPRADRPQRRRHRHGSNLCVLESGLFDGGRPLKDGVAPSRVLGRRVRDETRVVLRVQNALVTGVVRVVRIHVDGRQTRRVLEVPDQETRADIGSQVERLQARHAIEGTDDRLHRARQRQRLDRGVGERFVVDCCELGGVGRVILEGNFLQVGAFEGFVVDGAHTGGHPHLGQLGRESTYGRAPGLKRVQDLGLDAIVFPAPGTSEDIAMLTAYEYGAELIVAVGTHSNMIDFLEKGRKGMASTFLVRLKIGSKLIDAKGVNLLYKSKLKIKYIWAMIIAALFPVLILAYLSPTTQQFIRIMQLKLKLLLNM